MIKSVFAYTVEMSRTNTADKAETIAWTFAAHQRDKAIRLMELLTSTPMSQWATQHDGDNTVQPMFNLIVWDGHPANPESSGIILDQVMAGV